MSELNKGVSRRRFLEAIGAAGIGSVIGSKVFADSNEPNGQKESTIQPLELPKRKLGKTGVEIPCLAFGVAFNALDNQLILRKAFDWDVTTWDTSHFYENGNSELGIGKFFEKNPEIRKKILLMTKASNAKNPEEIEKKLQTSLQRMKTDYVDLYFGIHGLSKPAQLNDEVKKWAHNAKERKLIKYFGFSTHANMADCLMAASKLDWIDAVMTSYNFRLMQDKKLNDAVQACFDAGIGVIAMKTQGKEIVPNEDDKKLTEHFVKSGFTEGQAKIKAVLEDKRISAACVGRADISHLKQNVAAALDKRELAQTDKEVFKKYAIETSCGYCAGCSHICDAALAGVTNINDVMRSLMYHNSYGDKELAKQTFAAIPSGIRSRLLIADYRIAEQKCPQHMPIAKLVRQAFETLA